MKKQSKGKAKYSKTAMIRKLLSQNWSADSIAKKAKVSKSYVYAVKSKEARIAAAGLRLEKSVLPVAALPPESSALDVQIGGNHYKGMRIQPIQFIVANGIGFLEGNIIKRICRWQVKDGIVDLEKIKHEVDLLIELSENV